MFYGPFPGTPQPSTQGQRAALPQATPGAGAGGALSGRAAGSGAANAGATAVSPGTGGRGC